MATARRTHQHSVVLSDAQERALQEDMAAEGVGITELFRRAMATRRRIRTAPQLKGPGWHVGYIHDDGRTQVIEMMD